MEFTGLLKQELESFRRHDDERRKRTSAGLLAISSVTVKQHHRFCRGFVANRAASASAGEGRGYCGHTLFAYVESLAGFQEGFHAGEHSRPTPGDFASHGRTSLEVPVRYFQAHHVCNCLDFKSDARFVGEIVRIGPTQHEAFGWRAFQNLSGYPDLALLVPANVLPFRALLPIGDVFNASPILAREFGFGDGRPQFFRRGANECRVNLLWCLHVVSLSCFCFLRDPFSNRSTPEGDGVRICQSSARRSRESALD